MVTTFKGQTLKNSKKLKDQDWKRILQVFKELSKKGHKVNLAEFIRRDRQRH